MKKNLLVAIILFATTVISYPFQSISAQQYVPGSGPGPVIIPPVQQIPQAPPKTGATISRNYNYPTVDPGVVIPQRSFNMPSTPGPVIVSQSNFYFQGQFFMIGEKLYFLDCATGRTVPVAKTNAYQDVVSKYAREGAMYSEMNYANIRGFMQQDNAHNQELVVTYLTNISLNENCPMNSNIIGTYIAVSEAASGPMLKSILTIHGNYTYTYTTYNMNTNSMIGYTSGSWNFTDEGQLAFFYTNRDAYFAPTALVNYTNRSISWTTQTGTAFNASILFAY